MNVFFLLFRMELFLKPIRNSGTIQNLFRTLKKMIFFLNEGLREISPPFFKSRFCGFNGQNYFLILSGTLELLEIYSELSKKIIFFNNGGLASQG